MALLMGSGSKHVYLALVLALSIFMGSEESK